MKNRWDDNKAAKCNNDPLALRVYTSRLLGQEPDLVLHGGGNTSVKATTTDTLGQTQQVLFVKGSGWDLATIQPAGFAPVKLDVLQQLAQLDQLSDTDMVTAQRAAMTNPYAPNPSVEAILHAIIPFQFVDHTHADAVVAVTNSPDGQKRIEQIYGPRVLTVPYVMPGFILAKHVYEMTRQTDWSSLEGIVLLNHGIFTFADTARDSYDRMIKLVSEAEEYLRQHATPAVTAAGTPKQDLLKLASIRRAVAHQRGAPVIAQLDTSPAALGFTQRPDAPDVATRGPLTPDHVIRTKRIPLVVTNNPDTDAGLFADKYRAYFDRHTDGSLTRLDPAPRWALWPGHGTIAFGRSVKEMGVISDIVEHTTRAIQCSQSLGGWQALGEKDLFDMEYWQLEQAKLTAANASAPPPFQGKIALVTGAASGIGQATVHELLAQGAAVVAVDIDPRVSNAFDRPDVLPVTCDLTDFAAIKTTVDAAVRRFGGLDILISNAGTFPPSAAIADLPPDTWDQSLRINLTSHQQLLKAAIPYLKLGIDPAVVVIASKNVPAPGPGAAAYSVAKAGLTQLARVAALELAADGIRVNVIHPNAVFDTAVWTPQVLEARAAHYGQTVEQYKKSNLLKTEVKSKDVAAMAVAVAGPLFAKTTGAQIPIDGGNERVI